MTLKAVTKLAILLVALAALALPLTGTPVSAAQGNTVGKPTINGIPRVGETLTADTSTFSDPDGIAVVTFYKWRRYVGATETIIHQGGSTTYYTLVQADLGAEITVEVSYLDDNGATEMTLGSRVGPVLAAFDDRATLVALYDSTGGANWATNTNWNTTAALDTWHGVTTDSNGRVTRLDIWLNNLVGQIPDELGDLSKLEYLDLRSNNLNGPIPSSLGNLSSLTHLNLGGNKLTGAIPGALGGLSNLETLDLRLCGLSGEIPSELGDLSNLEYLVLSNNARTDIPGSGLTGTIPSELGGLSNLLELYLDDNRLTGIPSELGNLSSLRILSIPRNQLSGQIPSGLGSLSNVRELYFHYNRLTGPIPSDLGDLSNLEYLDLSNNASPDVPGSGLTGEIPASLGRLTKLINVRLDSNRLSGAIPSELGDLSSLGYMYLHENQLSEEIPASLGSLSSLIILHVNDNQLSGEIPDELDSLTILQDLRLNQNQLSGEIPDLSSLASLRILYLYDNQLSGEIPDTVGDLSNLESLYLFRNQLGGEIPNDLRNLNKLRNLYLSDNQLRGEIPAGLGDLTSLRYLILHNNDLSGEIPGELGSLNDLRYLYLSGNRLSGKIPVELSSLNNLQRLFLNRNQLSGEIPPELGSLPILQRLSLSNNQLSGPIPEELGELQGLKYARFAGNSLTECVPEGLSYLLTAPPFGEDGEIPAHDFIGVDANGDGDYDDEDDTPGLGLLFCGVGELSALQLSGVTLNPAFTSRRETYTGTAPYEVVSTTVTAELNRPDEDAFTIEKDGDIYTSGDAVPLIAGSSSPNVVTIEVTLPDSSTARTYTVVVTRKERERERVTVPSNWSLIPDGFGPGEQFRLLFVTSEDRDASSSSIADYDAFVREQAAQGHASIRSHSSKFRVVGSTEGFGARGHTSTTDVGVPIYYLNGEKIADNYNDFYDGSWDSVEPRNENGDVLTFVVVWTGTQSDGTCPSYCLGSESTTAGRPELQDGGLDGGTASGRFEDQFYALSPIFMVGGLPQATLKDSFKPPGSDLNGIWSDGTTIWVVDDEFHNETPDTIRAYRKSDQTRDDEKDITGRTMKAAGNVKPRGIWSDGMTMWVADSREDKIFAYDKTTRQRDASKDFYTLQAAGNNEPSGIWSDGMTMWVADPSDNKIYAYRMSDKSRDPDQDFDILSDNHNPRANQFIRADNTRTWLDNTNPHGIWSDGATMWVTNTLIVSTNRIYAYRMSDWSRDGARDLILPTHDADAGKDNKFPRHIWSDGTDIYVSDGYSDRIFVYSLPRGSSAQQNQALRAPGQPQKVAVNNRGVDEVTLNWDPPDSDGGSAITSYTVAYEPDDSSSKSTRRISRSHTESHTDNSIGSTRVTTTGTSFTVTGLTGGTEYAFRVIATNDVGDGPPSEEVLGTPLEPPPLEAEFPSSPYSSWTHSGTDDRPQVVVAFSRPVASFTASTPSVSVAGGTLLSGQAHEEQGLENAYILFLDPAGTDAIQFNLLPNEPCDSGGICAKDGTTLSVVPVTHTILGPATENSPATGHPTISGKVEVGETLAASISGIADADGLDNAVFAYLWLADDVGIAGATGSSYTVVDADEEKTIKVRVTFTDDGGKQETLTSEPTAAVAAKENTPATGAPTISGTARVGETLTASVGDIGDDDGIANAEFTYQWLADGAEITDATGGSYTLVDADAGKAIKVRASFTDDEGNAESLTSAATAVVEEAEPTEPPPKPTNLTARVNGDGSITLGWQAPDDDSVTGYQILRRRPTQGEDTLLVYVEDTGSTATTYTDTNVTAGVRHVYRVKAINSAGVGAQSNYVNPTP